MRLLERAMFIISVFGCFMLLPSLSNAEWFADLYVGGNFSDDAGLDNPPANLGAALADVPNNSPTIGGRLGHWFESIPWLGLAIDGSYFEPDIGDTEVFVVPISALLMFRLQLVPDDEFPKGTFEPYAGIGPGLFFADVDLDLSRVGLPGNYSDSTVELGLDFRLGFLANFRKNWGLFVEYRYTYLEADFEDEIMGQSVALEPEFKTHHGHIGVSYRF